MNTRAKDNDKGFTLVEMIVTVAIIGCVGAMVMMVMPGIVGRAKADSASTAVVNALRLARDRSIAERRNLEVRFIGSNKIEIWRQEIPIPPAVTAPPTLISSVYLEGNSEFLAPPTSAGDTPDQFGAVTAVAFGASVSRMFTSEGTFVDAMGDVLNGTVFLGVKGQTGSTRAVTVFGATALIRSWSWNGLTTGLPTNRWTE
jgi:prepilin-type N-terminal cleavage/methylation domain-containing protein